MANSQHSHPRFSGSTPYLLSIFQPHQLWQSLNLILLVAGG
uniref:Uncharacterized protein n=1 Tax=Arundo donax TaxID=35708 RepID=A0A0A8XY41_ARUDO